MRQLRIIEYAQRQRTAKTSDMKSFAASNGFIEKYPTTPEDRFKGELRLKNHPFLCYNFNDFMEKEPCTKFCGVVISSHEVIKL